ncbi:hypothetical protein [Synechococcus sp. NOUM97013]|uniref:hypothetical protein n=1 Tax=Synechococcus sp. NOUM97013 TaxID=1442555 RepID=UPI0016484C14|nr:hypothetical protein [Synechococcus sp. NOUM97013]QNI73798.1 putative conserved membrane protein [Synechococcus sp. NOUM97013]
MTIDSRCKEQQNVADKIFMDFKYTAPGSADQVRALKTLSFLISMWGDFLSHEERRMNSALLLKARS